MKLRTTKLIGSFKGNFVLELKSLVLLLVFLLAQLGGEPCIAGEALIQPRIANDDLETIRDVNGQKINVSDGQDYKLLYFWATWCPNCKEKFHGALNDFKKITKLDLILISTEKDSDLVKNYIEKEKITDKVFLDSQKILRKILQIDAIPAWALVKRDKDGLQVIAKETGFDEKDVMEKVVSSLPK